MSTKPLKLRVVINERDSGLLCYLDEAGIKHLRDEQIAITVDVSPELKKLLSPNELLYRVEQTLRRCVVQAMQMAATQHLPYTHVAAIYDPWPLSWEMGVWPEDEESEEPQ